MKIFVPIQLFLVFPLVVLIFTACGPTTSDALPGPVSPPSPSNSSGHCGDGSCDAGEQADPAFCPQDCAGGALPDEDTPGLPTNAPDYEPPINVFLVLHNDMDMDYETSTFETTHETYRRSYNEIDWLMQEAARHELRFTMLYLGWYTMWALEHNDLAQFEALLAAGHEIGTHVHPVTYDPEQDLWIGWPEELPKYGRPTYNAVLSHQAWDDSHRFLESVLDAISAIGQNDVVGPFPFKCSDEGLLMDQFGFNIAAGDRAEKGYSYFGHMVWNPWRPAANDEPGYEIAEDANATFISIDHYAQIGAYEEVHPVDLSLSQLQRHFLMLYTEWLSRERNGVDDRVWVFGFIYHPNYTDRYHDDLIAFLDWLDDNFIGKSSPHGNIIARYATVGEIAQQYYAWETTHPGISSFSYVQGEPYPYTYAIVPEMLESAAYESEVDLDEGIVAYRFSINGQPIYMIWSNSGARILDFSSQLSGQVYVTDSAGIQSMQDASMLPLNQEPLFVEPIP